MQGIGNGLTPEAIAELWGQFKRSAHASAKKLDEEFPNHKWRTVSAVALAHRFCSKEAPASASDLALRKIELEAFQVYIDQLRGMLEDN